MDKPKKKKTPAQKTAYAESKRAQAVEGVKAAATRRNPRAQAAAMQDLRTADNAQIKMRRAEAAASTFKNDDYARDKKKHGTK